MGGGGAVLGVGRGLAEDLDHAGRHVEAARLQHHGHHGQPRHQVVGRVLGGAPHPGMGGQGAVGAIHHIKNVRHKIEMLGFLVGGAHPVVEEADGHRDMGEPRDDVPVQVDGVELDMRHCMQDRAPPLRAAGAAARHVAGIEKLGTVGPRGAVGRAAVPIAGVTPGLARGEPRGGVAARQGGFFARVGGAQNRVGHLGKGRHLRDHCPPFTQTHCSFPAEKLQFF
jgi:hypothetical protein